MQYYILIDFGSTFTKAAVVSKKEQRVILSTQHPSTVGFDATVALKECLSDIVKVIGNIGLEKSVLKASSSAAGGLRMAVIGLTERLSLAAGKNVAYGAGAKIINVTAGLLTTSDLRFLETQPLEMLLFCGGYENGAQTVILKNAQKLAKAHITCPIIYGGNSVIASAVRTILLQSNKECFVVPNIIPNIGQLHTQECEKIIRDLFMHRIVNMKGLSQVKKSVGDIIPTPAAVLAAGNLLSQGTSQNKGYGEMLILDVGGATTDVHSYNENVAGEGARLVGVPEPYAKRTVEGDLGMRESADTLIQVAGYDKAAQSLGLSISQLHTSIDKRVANHDFVANTALEQKIDQYLAIQAVRLAVRRHCGYFQPVHSSNCSKLQRGKNLTNIKIVIGTGGSIINSLRPDAILSGILRQSTDHYLLLPEKSDFYVDYDYILYAGGLLSYLDRDFAFHVMDNSLKKGRLRGD